jgi:Putative Ig domain
MHNIIGKLKSYKRPVKSSILTIVGCALALCLAAALAISPMGSRNKVMAASPTVAIDMINYGTNSGGVDQTIINAHPEFLVDNSPAGPWKGDANISEYTAAGIKYFEYIDGGYENTEAMSIPNDLASNLTYITAAAKAGAYGIFLDEVSANPNAASISYLSQIYNAAHSLGLKVVFNTGVDSWSDSLMNYCDYINTSEVWNNTALTASQTKWAGRSWVLTQGVNDATTAANLSKGAWSKGLLAEYACSAYGTVPSWMPTYYSLVSGSSPVTSAPSVTTTTLSAGTIGTAYSQTLSATGGTTPYKWTISSGTLPAGLSLSTTGTISGTPSATCAATPVTFKVTDSNSAIATQSLAIAINSKASAGGNTTGTVASTPVSSGAANEYDLYLKITGTTVSGITAGQQVWCVATTSDFPNLLTVGSTLTGNLSNSPGWWTFKAASTSSPIVTLPTVTAPTAATSTATSVTSTGAIINGTLSSLGSSSSVAVSFNWGLTSSYGNTTAAKTMTSSNTFTATLTGLTPATTYHFRAVAAGSSTVYGSDITFTTGAAVVSTPPSTGNTTGTVASVPVSSGAANEYDLYLKISSTTVSGVTVGQQVWLAASATEYPNLLTVGSTISGNLSNSTGWWIIK